MRAALIRLLLAVSYWLGRILNRPRLRGRARARSHRLVARLAHPEHMSPPSRRTLFWRQVRQPPIVLFLFFVIYGLLSLLKDIASLLVKWVN